MLNTGISLQRLATKAGVGFTPKKLFSNGEAGVWYDPSDVEASLTWRRNLLEYTEAFDNSAWIKTGTTSVTSNAGVAPNGTQTADRVNNFDDAQGDRLKQTITITNSTLRGSVWVKGEGSNIGKDITLVIKRQGGTYTGSSSTHTLTDSWVRLDGNITQLSDNTGASLVFSSPASNSAESFLVWGAQIEQSSTATEYQPIRTTFDNAFKQAFPKHTLYQNEYGKTPVTGLGQAVGLMLDKSEGIALGNELVTNGDFATDLSGWSGAGWVWSNGKAYDSGASVVVGLVQTLSTTAEKFYALKFTLSNVSGGNPGLYWGGQLVTTYSADVTDEVVIVKATSGSTNFELVGGNATFFIDNVSVKEVKGSHATQSDSTKRPVFARHPERGRVNLLKYTEEFDNGFWGKSDATVIPNAIQSPTGESTADKIFDSGLASWSGVHLPNAGVTVTSGKTYTFSVFVKNAGLNWVQIGGSTPAFAGTYANVNLTTGEAGNSNTSVSVSDVGNGWFRVIISAVCIQTHANGSFFVAMYNSDVGSRLPTFSGQGSDGLYIWGAQLEEANEATGYQKVVDDYDITESGYKSVYYLQFDGVNDLLLINNLTSSATPLTAMFGFKDTAASSSTTYLLDIETGRTIFAVGNNQIHYYDGGWSAFDQDLTDRLVATFDTATNDAQFRVNGITEDTDNGWIQRAISGGVGLFGHYNGGARMQGNLYQCVVRAATSTDKEIDQAEEFVAIKTGLKSEVVGLATLDLNFGANTYTARNSNGSVL